MNKEIEYIGVVMENKMKEKTTAVIPFIEGDAVQALNGLDRSADIALSAYYKAEARGYEPSHELQDWLEAEAEVSNVFVKPIT